MPRYAPVRRSLVRPSLVLSLPRSLLIIGAFVLLTKGEASADDDQKVEAARHYEQGKAFFRVGEYALCAAEFQSSYQLVKKSGALFNRARCQEEQGDYQAAIESFRQYVAAEPHGAQAPEAIARATALRRKLEESETTVVAPPTEDIPVDVKEGTLTIVTQPDAEILIDAKRVGAGRFEGALTKGGHTLRVVAEGMRSYQSEIIIEAGQSRTIDVVLEEVAATVMVLPKAADTDSFELGASMATGVKFRGDIPLIAIIRGELALRLGSRVNFGVFAEYGKISTEGSCGFDMPGPMPETPFDFGPRLQFSNCSYVMPGAQVYVHILPKGDLDPYLGVAPGFRFGFADWTPYRDGEAQTKQDDFFPAIVVGVRSGLNYHPRPDFAGWEVGAYLEASITLAEDDRSGEFDTDEGAFFDPYLSVLGGVRTTVAF